MSPVMMWEGDHEPDFEGDLRSLCRASPMGDPSSESREADELCGHCEHSREFFSLFFQSPSSPPSMDPQMDSTEFAALLDSWADDSCIEGRNQPARTRRRRRRSGYVDFLTDDELERRLARLRTRVVRTGEEETETEELSAILGHGRTDKEHISSPETWP
ncbi:hypothetical protein PISL3812_09902 [Talaromyces islandicus]|uniref:Uncharacterized protein n=1 Tax=Talaromyces islandicus TaxID=28573 RepID=A0A0U1MCI9_TALIS|nr:hypothetical protein PISL3812_09902 [Talaromyces islandicus]